MLLWLGALRTIRWDYMRTLPSCFIPILFRSENRERLVTWPWAVFRGTCSPPGTPSSHDPAIWKKRRRRKHRDVIARFSARFFVRCFFFLFTTHLPSVRRSHSLWKTARLGSRRTASGNWLQARSTSSEICPNITELEMDEHELIGLRITLRIFSLCTTNRD